MKNKIVVAAILAFSALGFSGRVFGCAMACSAICRYTCKGTTQPETGCSDTDYATSLQACCAQAFANTPGIMDVPCGESGGS